MTVKTVSLRFGGFMTLLADAPEWKTLDLREMGDGKTRQALAQETGASVTKINRVIRLLREACPDEFKLPENAKLIPPKQQKPINWVLRKLNNGKGLTYKQIAAILEGGLPNEAI